jgi:O-antigen/teichoic acid export membrane protein
MNSIRSKQAAASNIQNRRTVLWSGLDYAIMPLCMLIATPVFVNYLGLEQYGVFVLVTALIGFSAVFNFGFGDTALKFVSHHLGLGNHTHAANMVCTIGALALGSGLLIGSLFALSAPLIASIFNLTSMTYSVPAIIMPLKLVESVYVATLRGCYRYDLAGAITVCTKLTSIMMQIGLAIIGYDLPILLAATASSSIISNLLLFYYSSKHLGCLMPALRGSIIAEIRHYSVWSWAQGIAGLVYANIDRLIIMIILGPTALGVYGVCVQLAQNIHYGLSATSHALFPQVSKIKSKMSQRLTSDYKTLRILYLTTSRSISVVAVITGSLMAVFSYQILDLWVGRDIAEKGHFLLSLLSLSYSWFAANSIVSYYTLNGLGLARLQAGISLISATIMALASIFLIPTIGLVGAAIARFPDAVFRLGVRIYLARSIVGGISGWIAFDFGRITLIAMSTGYLLKEVLTHQSGGLGFQNNPTNILYIAILAAMLFVTTYYLEGWIISKTLAATDSAQGTGK